MSAGVHGLDNTGEELERQRDAEAVGINRSQCSSPASRAFNHGTQLLIQFNGRILSIR